MNEIKVNEIIKKRREELGYSLRDLSEMIGVNSSTIMRWENGDIANMKRDKISSLAEALRISPAVIMGWEEPLKENNSTIPSTSELSEKQKELIDIMSQLSTRNQEALLEIAGSLKKTQQPGEANQDSHQ